MKMAGLISTCHFFVEVQVLRKKEETIVSKLKVKHKDNQIVVISKLSKIEEINQQELDVMHSKIIRGLMKPTVSKLNRITYLSPNGLTLKSYLANSITINDFFLIYAQVLEVIKSVDRNSFNINNLVMNLNFAFVNEKTKELHMVYQPIRTQVISTNIASFLYDIAYSVNLSLSEDYNEINRFINFMKSLQMISTEQIEQYILKHYPSIYKQVKRQKPGQSKILRGDDFYYHQNDFDKKNNSFENIEDDLAGDTALLDEDEDDATSLLVEEDDEATSLLTEDDDATALLVEQVKNYPYLIRLSTFDRTDVNKPVFRIGKERSYVDYFVQNNSAVSRLHADIITKGNQYFIKDNNSTNKTYVNGVDIPSEQEVEIFDGDEIVLANEKFEFHIY